MAALAFSLVKCKIYFSNLITIETQMAGSPRAEQGPSIYAVPFKGERRFLTAEQARSYERAESRADFSFPFTAGLGFFVVVIIYVRVALESSRK